MYQFSVYMYCKFYHYLLPLAEISISNILKISSYLKYCQETAFTHIVLSKYRESQEWSQPGQFLQLHSSGLGQGSGDPVRKLYNLNKTVSTHYPIQSH